MYDTIIDMKATNTNNTDLENFIVLREDQPDADYYNAIRAAERNEKVATATYRIIDTLAAAGHATARTVGIFMLDSYAGWYDSVNNTNTRQEIRSELGVSWLPHLSSTS